MDKAELTAVRLREVIHYDPETGVFNNLVRRGRSPAGADPSRSFPRDYRSLSIGKSQYLAHRLAWLYVTGAWPTHHIDHINGIRYDNRWVNLREATHAENMQNQRAPHKCNATGLLGVRKTTSGKYQARIDLNKKQVGLGSYETPEEAHAAYLQAKRTLHTHGPT